MRAGRNSRPRVSRNRCATWPALDRALAARFSHAGRRRTSLCVATGRTIWRTCCAIDECGGGAFCPRLCDAQGRCSCVLADRFAPPLAHVGRAMRDCAALVAREISWQPPADRRSGDAPAMS
ncbi:hypothetical protein F511_34603 [Dorcoceras hygrometricum]|uniref:Uncharacterized protein n=1 Tax=Dorcoceras hygrometricum TaxID=472368 RepID=A0A2Z7CV28_9LAMI|nr:hypothetical protein F511_34603 [Dorcoceras hygrometricum]